MDIKTAVEHFLATLFQDEVYSDCYVVEVDFTASGLLEVYVDADKGMDLGRCRLINKATDGFLQAENLIESVDKIEVSSPGIDRPLVFPRQFIKNLGREISIQPKVGETVEGALKEANDTGIIVVSQHKEKEGKKNVLKTIEHQFKYDTIDKAIIKIRF